MEKVKRSKGAKRIITKTRREIERAIVKGSKGAERALYKRNKLSSTKNYCDCYNKG